MQKDELSVEAIRTGNVDFTFLKQILSEDKLPPRDWAKALIAKFISIVSITLPTQKPNPTSSNS